MGQATGFYQTLSFLEVAPQVAQFGPTLMWSTGPGLLIKKRVNYSLCKFLVIREIVPMLGLAEKDLAPSGLSRGSHNPNRVRNA